MSNSDNQRPNAASSTSTEHFQLPVEFAQQMQQQAQASMQSAMNGVLGTLVGSMWSTIQQTQQRNVHSTAHAFLTNVNLKGCQYVDRKGFICGEKLVFDSKKGKTSDWCRTHKYSQEKKLELEQLRKRVIELDDEDDDTWLDQPWSKRRRVDDQIVVSRGTKSRPSPSVTSLPPSIKNSLRNTDQDNILHIPRNDSTAPQPNPADANKPGNDSTTPQQPELQKQPLPLSPSVAAAVKGLVGLDIASDMTDVENTGKNTDNNSDDSD